MEGVNPNEAAIQPLRTFIEKRRDHENFRAFMKDLLSTFMPEKYIQIYMSEKLQVANPSKLNVKGQTPSLIDRGPFEILERAFTHKYVTTFNSESLETLGDAILKSAMYLFVFKNWPTILEPALLTRMGQTYLVNYQFANYSDQLGFTQYINHDINSGLNVKERADAFESFVGAITMIGEFFIGDGIGNYIATEFCMKFYALQQWEPYDEEFYIIPSSLYNDWRQALPAGKKPLLSTKEWQNEDGSWTKSLYIGGEVLVPFVQDNKLAVVGYGTTIKEASENAYNLVVQKLSISRKAIDDIRRTKQSETPEIDVQVTRLERMNSKAVISRIEGRAGRRYAFVQEPEQRKAGTRTVTIWVNKTRGIGMTDTEAVKDAVDAYEEKNFLIPMIVEPIYNPDTDPPIAVVPTRATVKPGGALHGDPKSAKVTKSYSGMSKSSGGTPPTFGRGRGKVSTSGGKSQGGRGRGRGKPRQDRPPRK